MMHVAAGTAAMIVALSASGLALDSRPAPPAPPAPALIPSPAPASIPSTAPADAKRTPDGWFAPIPRGTPAPPLPKEVTRVVVIPIREEITQKTFDALERKAVRCRASGAELVILDMDTWGGEVIAALDITRLIKTELKDIYTVCYVRTRAISAGAMIAMACNEIVMTPVGTFGDCAPISPAMKLEGVEREKIETVLRTEFENSANRNGYNVALSHAMVSIETEVWLVRNKRTRELRYVDAEEFRGQVEIPPGLASAPSNPQGEWELLKVADSSKKLLTMTAENALQFGFTREVIDSPRDKPLEALLKHYNVVGEPTVLNDNWSEKLVEFLTSAPVAGFLMFVGIVCVYIEMNHPGLILPAAVALICFGIFFGSRYLVGMAQWWHIVVFVAGLALILIEVFLTPTFGVLGVVGIVACIVGLLALVVPTGPGEWPIPKSDLDWRVFRNAAFAMGAGFVAAVIAAAAIARHLPRMPLAGRLILAQAPTSTGSPVGDDSAFNRVRVGDVGVAETMCRPVGKVRFGEALLDASSEGDIIELGAKVHVLQKDANRLIVEKVQDA